MKHALPGRATTGSHATESGPHTVTEIIDDNSVSRAPKPAFQQPDEEAGMHAERERFFAVVHRLEIRVSRDLLGEPLALYRPMFEAAIAHPSSDGHGGWRMWNNVPQWQDIQYATEHTASGEEIQLRDALLRWSRKWHLTDEWCLGAAVDTLAAWSAEGGEPEPCPLSYSGIRMVELPFSEDELRFSFSHRGWHPTLESWESAEEWLDDSYRRTKQDYRRRVESLAAAAGLTRVQRRRTRKGDHMEWLARAVVKQQSYARIARDEKVTYQAVSEAVRKEAVAIGLSLPGA